jgi:hypothetical protein
MDLTTEKGVVAYMSQATSEDDWNSRRDKVKAANGGYPGFWYQAIILSGVFDATRLNWVSRNN